MFLKSWELQGNPLSPSPRTKKSLAKTAKIAKEEQIIRVRKGEL